MLKIIKNQIGILFFYLVIVGGVFLVNLRFKELNKPKVNLNQTISYVNK